MKYPGVLSSYRPAALPVSQVKGGGWRVESGKCRVESGEWRVEGGE